MGMVLEIAVAAIVRASLTGQADPYGHLVIGISHFGIQTRKFFEQDVFHWLYFSF
jgi:hypothetical protein